MNAAIARQHLIQIGRLAMMRFELLYTDDPRFEEVEHKLFEACDAFQNARPGGVWGGERCTDCNAPLRRALDRIIGVCDPCMSRWTALAVIGAPSGPLAGNDGGHIPYAELTRIEQQIDCNRDLTRVECSVCESGCLVDHAPDGPYVCDYCNGEREMGDPWD